MAKKVVSRATTTAVLSSLLLCLTVLPAAGAVWFDIPRDTGSKCVLEDLKPNVIVMVNYYLIGQNNSDYSQVPVTSRVSSPYGNTLHQSNNATYGQFAFTTKEAGIYEACFKTVNKIPEGTKVTMSIDWKIGIATKDWEVVAKKEHLDGVELEIKKLEETVSDIHTNMFSLIEKEMNIFEVIEKTNNRVVWYSVTSLGVCGLTSVLQIWRLKRYFVKKRLI